MGTLFIGQIKKQASSFLHDKYQTARLALTDVTRAELLAEEVTNSDPWSPDVKTTAQIAEASYDLDDYWRIVDVIHKRFDQFDTFDHEKWRQCYKTLALLEFLLTHGPHELAGEFQCDADVIEQLGTFQYIDENGFNWGANMQKRSSRVLRLLIEGETLKEARSKALKLKKEIQGFGNFPPSPTSTTSTCSSSTSSPTFRASFWTGSPTFDSEKRSSKNTSTSKQDLANNKSSCLQKVAVISRSNSAPEGTIKNKKFEGLINVRDNWDCPRSQENGYLLDNDKFGEKEKYNSDGLISGICSKFVGTTPTKKGYGDNYDVLIRSVSDVGRLIKRKCDSQFSAGY